MAEIKTNTFLCVDLKVRAQKEMIQNHETRVGYLSKVNDDHFEFDEAVEDARRRNPKIYRGQRINVVLNQQGRCLVYLRQLELTADTPIRRIGREIIAELKAAQHDLDLSINQ
mgnify:CR=1 FL=1